jgi:hypothetical protein
LKKKIQAEKWYAVAHDYIQLHRSIYESKYYDMAGRLSTTVPEKLLPWSMLIAKQRLKISCVLMKVDDEGTKRSIERRDQLL